MSLTINTLLYTLATIEGMTNPVILSDNITIAGFINDIETRRKYLHNINDIQHVIKLLPDMEYWVDYPVHHSFIWELHRLVNNGRTFLGCHNDEDQAFTLLGASAYDLSMAVYNAVTKYNREDDS